MPDIPRKFGKLDVRALYNKIIIEEKIVEIKVEKEKLNSEEIKEGVTADVFRGIEGNHKEGI